MKRIMINGAPRSGTSWLGQIFDSSIDTVFRFQPLFSYEFKDYLSEHSSEEECNSFFEKCIHASSDFVTRKDHVTSGLLPRFSKSEDPSALVIKHVRYHNILSNIARKVENVRFVFVIRSPFGVIDSWMNTPREFDPSWPKSEWRSGRLKNMGKPEEFYGYCKWKESSDIFLNLKNIYPDRVFIVRYESLCLDRFDVVRDMFDFCNISMCDQTLDFLNNSSLKNINHPDTVYRPKDNHLKWKTRLDADIIKEIELDLAGTELERFIR